MQIARQIHLPWYFKNKQGSPLLIATCESGFQAQVGMKKKNKKKTMLHVSHFYVFGESKMM